MVANLNSNPFDAAFLAWLERQDGAVLLETARPDPANQRSLLFLDPVRVVRADHLGEVERALESIAEAVEGGLHAAGWIAYEAGFAFESVLQPLARPAGTPLVWMGLYERPLVYDHRSNRFDGHVELGCGDPQTGPDALQPEPSLGLDDYAERWRCIREQIADGDTYQVNLTFKLRFAHQGSAGELYARLRRAQPVPYAAFIRTGDETILSFSPELFFRTDGRRIVLRPMKGTAPRGDTPREDRANRAWLESSPKNRAENLMIVDMLRNDVGRIAAAGSVKVPRFFAIEAHPTLFQATSTIEARLRSEIRIPEIVSALFPSGSVTGAPKIRTMQIIHHLEPEPRGVYTGAIGYLAPGDKAVFNVAIRTLTLGPGGAGEMGVGSGIVADSEASSEYEECLLKGRFLGEAPNDYELFETLLWVPGKGWRGLPRHLARLTGSARRLGFRFSRSALVTTLKDAAEHLPPSPHRGRLTLNRSGGSRVETAALGALEGTQRVRISGSRTFSRDPLLRHKTSRRELYDDELRRAQADGCFDVLFLNEHGELTEGARSNVLLRFGSVYKTPPTTCGLLPGTARERLLAGRLDVRVEALSMEDLRAADAVYVCNALRGLLEVEVE